MIKDNIITHKFSEGELRRLHDLDYDFYFKHRPLFARLPGIKGSLVTKLDIQHYSYLTHNQVREWLERLKGSDELIWCEIDEWDVSIIEPPHQN